LSTDITASASQRIGVETAAIYLDGALVGPADGYYDILDPATEQVAARAPQASAAQATAATVAARRAAGDWARTPVEQRAELVAALATALAARADELIALIRAETGATVAIAEPQQFRHALSQLSKWSRLQAGDFVTALPAFIGPGTRPGTSMLGGAVVNRQPAGVVACITPFNYPLLCACAMIGPALVSGNAVVLKPAPANPMAVLALAEAAIAVGLPPGVLNIVNGTSPDVGAALVGAPDVDLISFTGSTAVGRQIAGVAGQGMKRVLLELGGKGAAVVFDDADLDDAAAAIATTWTRHSGQVCTAPTRVIAHRAVHTELVERLAALADALTVGDPSDPQTAVGPLTTRAHRERVEGYIRSATAEGGSVVTRDRPPSDRGYYVAPTLITGGEPSMTAVREEIFGPVVVAMTPFADDAQALQLANDTAFGLHDYIWSGDTARAYRFASQLRTGYVGINTVVRSPDAPFGGFGLSGLGRDGGRFSLTAYTEPQSIIWGS
jgi:phenylacetaldehyde dehydrogenase